MTDLFYFLCYPDREHQKIRVIDLQCSMDWERSDWRNVTPDTYRDRDKAIEAARLFAESHNLTYVLFNSRYDEETNEYLGEFGLAIESSKDMDRAEMMIMNVSESDWEQMITDIKEEKIDSIGGVRIRLMRLFSEQ